MAGKNYKETNASTGPFQWLFIVVIPFIFALVLATIIAALAGINVGNKAKQLVNNVPFVSKLVVTEEEMAKEEQKKKASSLENELNKKNETITELELAIQQKDGKIADLNKELEKLIKEKEELQLTEQQANDRLQSFSASFKEMDPEAAAPILLNLEIKTATKLLETLPTEQRGNVLAAMEPAEAAKLASVLLNGEEMND
ncbi:hypothetical protein NC797_03515 [Aquibacillus sp. 3ASR75-11]|uniref:Magnesium transporter MgtE intracellular domain-containing protein n=1 Tax=Terrihalobacillus insolitus TaxID=2950438 RepID=A0A9X3WSS7_9BACI|nr:hypothetical protein [Terrihalobacillus insolitus]MDC3423576.1 hypothetical protein [Terrihalobacillus insolitus]